MLNNEDESMLRNIVMLDNEDESMLRNIVILDNEDESTLRNIMMPDNEDEERLLCQTVRRAASGERGCFQQSALESSDL